VVLQIKLVLLVVQEAEAQPMVAVLVVVFLVVEVTLEVTLQQKDLLVALLPLQVVTHQEMAEAVVVQVVLAATE
jgi:hypothetical protein